MFFASFDHQLLSVTVSEGTSRPPELFTRINH